MPMMHDSDDSRDGVYSQIIVVHQFHSAFRYTLGISQYLQYFVHVYCMCSPNFKLSYGRNSALEMEPLLIVPATSGVCLVTTHVHRTQRQVTQATCLRE